jgi:predicted ATPase
MNLELEVPHMQIESMKIKNFRALQDVKINYLPSMAVFLGKNGSGKTTFFDVFGFLYDYLTQNIRAAMAKRGGFHEVISRNQVGDIEFEIKFRPAEDEPLITYELSIARDQRNNPVVKREVLRFRRGQGGKPWKVLDFSFGEGTAAKGDIKTYDDVKNAPREVQKLDFPDILAIKGLGQFKEFVAVSALRRLIEDWYVSDFHVSDARERQEAGYSSTLTKSGDNLALVAKFLRDEHPEVFDRIIENMRQRVPGMEDVEAMETGDGYVVLRFQDGTFKNPFSAKFVSDGTIKMFTYLVLLNDPTPHTLLCVEEPENQLYPGLLQQLVEEFRLYACRGQVFISTHSPILLDAVRPEELFCLFKKDGYTSVRNAADSELVRTLWKNGDLLGGLWTSGILMDEVDRL